MTEEDEGIRQSWAPGMERSVQRALQESEEEEGEGEEVEGEGGREATKRDGKLCG